MPESLDFTGFRASDSTQIPGNALQFSGMVQVGALGRGAFEKRGLVD